MSKPASPEKGGEETGGRAGAGVLFLIPLQYGVRDTETAMRSTLYCSLMTEQ
jgi:hypothetical protein